MTLNEILLLVKQYWLPALIVLVLALLRDIIIDLITKTMRGIFSTFWTRKDKSKQCLELLKEYRDYYPQDQLKRHEHRYVERKEEDSTRDYLKDFESFLESGERFLTIKGEGGIGKTRLCIELSKKRDLKFVNVEGFENSPDDFKKRLDECLKKDQTIVFEDYQEHSDLFRRIVELVNRKGARLIVLSRLFEIPELANEKSIMNFELKRMKNVEDLIDVPEKIKAWIKEVSGGVPGIAKLAETYYNNLEENKKTPAYVLEQIHNKNDLFDSILKDFEKLDGGAYKYLAKVALLRGVNRDSKTYTGHYGYLKNLHKCGYLSMGNVIKISPDILNDYLVRKYYFDAMLQPEFEEVIKEHVDSSLKILTTLIIVDQIQTGDKIVQEAIERLLETVKESKKPKLIVDVGLMAYYGLVARGSYNIDFMKDRLGPFWRHTSSVKDPSDFVFLGNFLFDIGEYDEAVKLYNESQEIKKKLGDQSGIAGTLHQIAMIHQNKGEYEEALKLYKESLEIKKKLGNQSGIATTLAQMSLLYEKSNDVERAHQCIKEANAIFKKLGQKPYIEQSESDLKRIEGELK